MTKQHITKCVTSVLASIGMVSVAYGHGDLGETTAIASRADQQLDTVIGSIFSVDSTFFTDRGVNTLSTGLDLIEGVYTSKSGGQRGSIRGLSIRGMRSTDYQLRIDGVRVSHRSSALSNILGSASTGGFERIELLKGSQGALYGGDAVSGVVSLQTGVGGEAGSKFFTEVGSFDTLRASLAHRGSVGGLSYFLQQEAEFTGNDTYDGNSEIAKFDNDFVSYTSSLRLEYALSEDLNVGLTYRNHDFTYENPQFGGTLTDVDSELATFYSSYQVNDIWRTKLILSVLDDTAISNGTPTDYNQRGITWENSLKYSDALQVAFGAEFEKTKYDNQTIKAEDIYRAVYANVRYDFEDKLSTQVGVRAEDYNTFGSQVTWNAGAAYDVTNQLRIRAAVGTGFKTPSFFELYSPSAFAMGNSNLVAEESLTWEVSVDYQLNDDNDFTVSYFEGTIDDSITYVFPSYENRDRSVSNGVELNLSGKLAEEWRYSVSYTHLDNKLTDGFADQTAAVNLEYAPSDAWSVGVIAKYEGDRNVGTQLDSFYRVDVYGNYKLSDNVTITGRVENVGDAEYSYAQFGANGYPAARIGGYLGVKVEW